MNYRTKPASEEFELLDAKDEIQIERGRGSFCHVLASGNGQPPLVSVSFCGMLEIAWQNHVYKVGEHYDLNQSQHRITATCSVCNRSDTIRVGAAQTTGQPDPSVAISKAFRNGIRQSVSPVVINKFLDDWLLAGWRKGDRAIRQLFA